MPRNNGIYTPPPSTWNPAVDGQPADPESWNDLLADISAALSQSVSKDGQTQITGDVNWGGNRITALGAAITDTDALRRASIVKGENISSASTITIPSEGSLFDVTGENSISAIAGSYSGRIAALRFEKELIIQHSSSLLCPAERNLTTYPGQLLFVLRVSTTAWLVFTGSGSGYSFEIGDFLDSARNPGSDWLRRDGRLYMKEDYPILADMLPPLPDGFDWESVSLPSGFNLYDQWLSYVNGRLLLTGTSSNLGVFSLYSSPDKGMNWSTLASISGTNLAAICPVAHGNDTYVSAINKTGVVLTSADGNVWTERTVKAGQNVFYVAFYDVEGVFIAVGAGGLIATSTNGISWTERTSGISSALTRVSVFDDVIVVTGVSGQLLTSVNGISWTVRTTGVAASIGSVARKSGRYVAVMSFSGGILWSEDLASWFPVSISGMSSVNGIIVTNGDNFVIPSGLKCFFSGDGVVWDSDDMPYNSTASIADPDNPDRFLFAAGSMFVRGMKTSPSQFRVPDDDPQFGWIKAL